MCWICLFSKSSWITTTVSGLSYELGVNGEEKVNGNWDIINKNWHSTFQTGKPGNSNNYLYYDTVTCQCQKSVMVISILQMICIGHVLEALGLYQQKLL